MKRIFSILLLFILAFDFAGVIVLYKFQQGRIRREIKRQIKRGISEDELHEITMHEGNSSEIVWKNSNEFVYHGQLYDIVRKELKDDSVIYYCINDTQEEALFACLDELVRQRNDNETTKTAVRKLLDILSKVTFTQVAASVELAVRMFIRNDNLTNSYTNPYLGIVSPPPQAA